jgi:hypothetical protein
MPTIAPPWRPAGCWPQAHKRSIRPRTTICRDGDSRSSPAWRRGPLHVGPPLRARLIDPCQCSQPSNQLSRPKLPDPLWSTVAIGHARLCRWSRHRGGRRWTGMGRKRCLLRQPAQYRVLIRSAIPPSGRRGNAPNTWVRIDCIRIGIHDSLNPKSESAVWAATESPAAAR